MENVLLVYMSSVFFLSASGTFRKLIRHSCSSERPWRLVFCCCLCDDIDVNMQQGARSWCWHRPCSMRADVSATAPSVIVARINSMTSWTSDSPPPRSLTDTSSLSPWLLLLPVPLSSFLFSVVLWVLNVFPSWPCVALSKVSQVAPV